MTGLHIQNCSRGLWVGVWVHELTDMSAVTRFAGSKGQLYVHLPDLHAKQMAVQLVGTW